MYSNTFEFYRSDQWRKLMQTLRMERVNADGELICEHCGKPITRAYDAIGHHVIELTDENVRDASIALNPNNVMIIHHKCHNIIHNRLGINQRQVFLVYGAPLSGKTTWVNDNMIEGDLIVDMNNIWACVSGCDRYTKPKRLNAVAFKLRDTLLECVQYRTGHWLNAYIVGGYPLISERERLCKQLGAREVFIEATLEQCMDRLNDQSELDAQVWAQYITDWFARYIPPDALL